MQTADSTEGVVEVFNELTQIRGDIERITGQLQYFDESAAYSSLNVNLSPPERMCAKLMDGNVSLMPASLANTLSALAHAFEVAGVDWFLFGAQAAIVRGRRRMTADVDVCRPWPVTAFSASTFLPSAVALKNAFASRTLPTPLVPRTATALRFFDAITVPTPERPAARCRSLTTAA